MKLMKSVTALLLAAAIIFLVCACSPKEPLIGKWSYELPFSDIVQSYVKNVIDSADNSQKAMYEELFKAFDGCTVNLVLEFKNDNTFNYAPDKDSAVASVEKIKDNLKTAIPAAYKAIGLGDEEFGAYLKAQGKTINELVEEMSKEFSVDKLTNGVQASGIFAHEGNRLYLFKDEKDDSKYCEITLEGDKLTVTKVVGEVDGFKNVEKLLPMKFTKI